MQQRMATAWVGCWVRRGLGVWLLAALAFFSCCLVGRPAHAWVETDVVGHQATLSVDKDGHAEVRHTLHLRLRGGPLESLDLDGIGPTLETLADGTVRRAQSGNEQVWPLGVEPREDGGVHLRIESEKGLRSGTYQFEFGYRISLDERKGFERRGDRVRLTWIGPRFSGGVDSAKVVFRLPQSTEPPTVPESTDGETSGVLLSQVRRGAGFDEIELVRAYVARGEPAVWRVEMRADPFSAALERPDGRALGAAVSPPPPRMLELPTTPRWVWSLSLGLGFVYALLCYRKGRAQAENAREVGATPRALVPLPNVARSLFAGALLGAAAGLGLAEYPTWAGLCLCGALLMASLLPPLRLPRARGPGEWSRLSEDELRAQPAKLRAGRFLDASTVPGFVVFLLVALASAAAAWLLLPRSPYQAGLVLLGSAACLPLFFTGKMADIPPDAAFGALPLHHFIARKLARRSDVRSEVWARRPLGGGAPDELRLRIFLDGARSGLSAIEIGLEIGAGMLALPCVIVRAQDESDAYHALPRGVVWVRGRNGDERVAILRPRVPTRAQCLRIVEDVLALTSKKSEGGMPRAQRERKSAAMSSGRGAVTANAGTPSPTPAT